jgi:threonine aldolase
MDGARIANAVASLGVPIAEFTADAGVDILSFGGTKNGMMYGEAVVFFRPEQAENFKYYRKQGMQLASKMRYIAAQFQAMLHNDLWIHNAQHANTMAQMLAERITREIPQIEITQPVEANGIFAIVPPKIIEPLRNDFFFYTWDENRHEVRWMTSWDTTPDEINQFLTRIKHHLHHTQE